MVYYRDTEKGRIWSTGAAILCSDNHWVSNPSKELLLKEGWIPFLPSEPTLYTGNEPIPEDLGLKEFLNRYPDYKESLKIITSGIMYHYTTWEVLFNGILSSQNIAKKQLILHAYSINYMNDETEGLLIPKAISIAEEKWVESKIAFLQSDKCSHMSRAFVEGQIDFLLRSLEFNSKNAIKERQSLFSVSFSKVADSLPMWQYYGHHGEGLSIGFDSHDIYFQGYYFLDCVYDRDIIGKIGKSLFECRYEMGPDVPLKVIAKDSHFEYEQESRIAIKRFNKEYCITKRDQFLPIKYSIKRGFIVPYVEVLLPITAIKEIWIGPTNNKDLAEDSLRGWLDSIGLSSVKIMNSTAPLV